MSFQCFNVEESDQIEKKLVMQKREGKIAGSMSFIE